MAGQDVTIRIGGTTTTLSAALNMASADLDMLREQMSVAADAAKVLGEAGAQAGMAWVESATNAAEYADRLDQLQAVISTVSASQDADADATRMLTEQLQLAQDTTSTLADANAILGDSYTQQAMAFLNAATSADDYAARLDYLQTQIAGATAAQDDQAFSMTGLAQAFDGGNFSLTGLVGVFGDAAGPVGILTGAIDDVVGSIGDFISQSASMLIALVGWQAFMDAANYVQQLVDPMFQLNEQTQRITTAWKYLFGGGTKGAAISQNMMTWAQQESTKVPFTEQDMLQAITTMLTMPGMNEAQVEKYLPMISDLGATLGAANQLNLSQTMQAIVGAEFGRTMMLRYELHINPQDLAKYGLAITKTGHITDMSTFLPALEKYAQAKGLLGASGDIETNTFWGAWSSFVDRFQRAALELGGLSMSGTPSSNSMFGALMNDLVNISSWWDAHQTDMVQIEDILATLVGGAVQGGGGLLGAFFQMIGQSGVVGDFVGWVQDANYFLSGLLGTPQTPTAIAGGRRVPGGAVRYGEQMAGYTPGSPNQFAGWGQDLAKITEALTGNTAKLLEQVLQDAAQMGPGAASAMQSFGQGWQFLASSVTPAEAQAMEEIAKWMIASFVGSVAAAAIGTIWTLGMMMTNFGTSLQAVSPLLVEFEHEWEQIPAKLQLVEGLFGNLGNWFQRTFGQMETANNSMWEDYDSRVETNFNNLLKWLEHFFTGLKNDSYSWATDMMDAFIKGIQDKMSALQHTVSGVAGAVSSKLHFSRPDEGPLADYESWMPDMMRTLAAGMRAGLPEVSRAAAETSSAIAAPMSGYGGRGGASSSSYNYANNASDSRALHQTFYGSSEAYMNHVAQRAQQQFNHSSNLALRRPGGFARFGEIGPTPGLAR